jgi:hypothetical protein
MTEHTMADTVGDILRKARDTMDTAAMGLRDLQGPDPKRRMIGLRNVVVFGRSVSYVLQTLRRIDRLRFDAWYAPYEREMRGDALMRYFHDLRNKILKEGPRKPPATCTWRGSCSLSRISAGSDQALIPRFRGLSLFHREIAYCDSATLFLIVRHSTQGVRSRVGPRTESPSRPPRKVMRREGNRRVEHD